jgi:hypothetical protein
LHAQIQTYTHTYIHTYIHAAYACVPLEASLTLITGPVSFRSSREQSPHDAPTKRFGEYFMGGSHTNMYTEDAPMKMSFMQEQAKRDSIKVCMYIKICLYVFVCTLKMPRCRHCSCEILVRRPRERALRFARVCTLKMPRCGHCSCEILVRMPREIVSRCVCVYIYMHECTSRRNIFASILTSGQSPGRVPKQYGLYIHTHILTYTHMHITEKYICITFVYMD